MAEPAYPTARQVAQTLHNQLVRHSTASGPKAGKATASIPDTESIEAIVGAAFWSSLRREEGRTPSLSLAYVAPAQVPSALTLERPLPLIAEALTRVAPAVERPGIHLGVWPHEDRLMVWGATRDLPAFCFVMEVIAPGLLVIKQSPADESGKFVNLAVLEGDAIRIVDQTAARVPDCPDLLSSLLQFESQHARDGNVNVLIQLAVSMRAHGRGGLLLVVPSNSTTWQESIVQPMLYAVSPPFAGLTDLMQASDAERNKRAWQDALRRAVDGVAGLTAVDGAT